MQNFLLLNIPITPNIIYYFIFGVSPLSIVLSLFSEGLISFAAFKIFRPSLSSNKPRLFLNIEKVSTTFVVSLMIALISTIYILYTQVLFSSHEGYQVGGGGLYGDTALHLAYTARLQTGEFPPQNPLYTGKILVYPFANDLLSAVLRINGMHINLAFILPQIIFLTAFLTLFYVLVRKFTSDQGFLFSFLLISFGWGVGFVFFLRDFLIGDTFAKFSLVEYTNNPQYNLLFYIRC